MSGATLCQRLALWLKHVFGGLVLERRSQEKKKLRDISPSVGSTRRSIEPRASLGRALAGGSGGNLAFFENALFENAFFENFANFWRARSRLYQNEILQENMRSTAVFKLYKICILLHRSKLNILARNRFEISAIFVTVKQQFCKCCKICEILPTGAHRETSLKGRTESGRMPPVHRLPYHVE